MEKLSTFPQIQHIVVNSWDIHLSEKHVSVVVIPDVKRRKESRGYRFLHNPNWVLIYALSLKLEYVYFCICVLHISSLTLEHIFRNYGQSLWHIPLKIFMVADFEGGISFYRLLGVRENLVMFFWSPD